MSRRALLAVMLLAGLAVSCGAPPESTTTPAAVPAQTFPAEYAAPSGRALTIEDYYRIASVRAPRISPDGRRVAYSISTPVEEDNSDHTTGWVVATDGASPPVPVTHAGEEVTGLSFTDEGMLRYRAADALWTFDPDDPGATPVRVASGDDEPGPAPIPSPDGSWIARLEEVAFPKEEAVFASDFERRHQERFEGVVFDWMYFQRDGAEFPVPDPRRRPAQEIVLSAADGGAESRLLGELDLRPSSVGWQPDGARLVFVADSHFRDEMTYGRPDLWTVTVDGEVTRLTDDGFVYSSPEFSPDGRFISYTRSFGTDMIIEQKLDRGGSRDLFVLPVDGGEPINLTANWDHDPRGVRWAPEGSHLYFIAGVGGTTHLFRVPVDGGEVEQLTHGQRRINSLTIDRDFRTIAYTVGRIEAPSELFVADIDGSNERQLTHVHDALLDEIELSRAERLLFASYDGTPIEGWLLYPYGYTPRPDPIL